MPTAPSRMLIVTSFSSSPSRLVLASCLEAALVESANAILTPLSLMISRLMMTRTWFKKTIRQRGLRFSHVAISSMFSVWRQSISRNSRTTVLKSRRCSRLPLRNSDASIAIWRCLRLAMPTPSLKSKRQVSRLRSNSKSWKITLLRATKIQKTASPKRMKWRNRRSRSIASRPRDSRP